MYLLDEGRMEVKHGHERFELQHRPDLPSGANQKAANSRPPQNRSRNANWEP